MNTNIARKRATHAVPPAVGGETSRFSFPGASAFAKAAGDPRAVLLLLREEAAAEIDRLLAFLDATEGDVEAEESCEGEGEACDDEGDAVSDDEDNHDMEAAAGRPVLTAACGRVVRI